MKTKGFTLIELVVAVAIASGLVAVAAPIYQNYIARSQAAEAEKLINGERPVLMANMQKGYCVAPGTTSSKKGRYGTLAVSGTFVPSKGETCDSGCKISYTLNSDVSKLIADKKVTVDMRLNGEITKNSSLTTIDSKFLTTGLNNVGAVAAGDNCAALSTADAVKTPASPAIGNEWAMIAPPGYNPDGSVDINSGSSTTTNNGSGGSSTTDSSSSGNVGGSANKNCVKYKAQFQCQNSGLWSCWLYKGSIRNGTIAYFDGQSPTQNLNDLTIASQVMGDFFLTNGHCPSTSDELKSVAYKNVRMSCKAVDISKLEVNSACAASAAGTPTAGTPYGYLWRFNQNYMGGTMPMVELGCVYQSNTQGKVKVVMPVIGYPTTIDTLSQTEAYVTADSFKSQAKAQCDKAYTKLGVTAFNALSSVDIYSVGNSKVGLFFVKF